MQHQLASNANPTKIINDRQVIWSVFIGGFPGQVRIKLACGYDGLLD